MHFSELDKRKEILQDLESCPEINSFVLFDELFDIIHEFTHEYLGDIDLSRLTREGMELGAAVGDGDPLRRYIMLTEKGILFLYKFNTLSLLILAGYRESTDVFELQLKLDTIVSKLRI